MEERNQEMAHRHIVRLKKFCKWQKEVWTIDRHRLWNSKMNLKAYKKISIPGVEVATDEARDVDEVQNIMDLKGHVRSYLGPGRNRQSFEWF